MYDMSSKSCVLHRLFLSRTETLRNASCIDPIIFIDKILHSILTHILKNISPFDFSSSYVVCQFRLDTFGGFPLSCIPPINPSSRYKVKLCRSRPDSSLRIFSNPAVLSSLSSIALHTSRFSLALSSLHLSQG